MFRKIAITSAFFASTIAPATAEIMWGANGHPLTAYPGTSIERQFDYLEDLGMKSYRVNVVDASSLDRLTALVEEGKKRGITVLPVLTPGGIDLTEDSAEELYEKAHGLAQTLAAEFKDDIPVWELGNEMENLAIIQPCEKRDDGTVYPCEWGPAGGVDVLDYYGPRWVKVSAVLKGLSDGISAVDPDLKKAMGTAGWGHVGAFTRMEDDGIDWDISVWHIYGEDPEWAFRKLARFERPIWVTEFNNPAGSHRSDEQQAEGLRQVMLRLRQLETTYDIEAAHIYELMDEPYFGNSFEADMGLVRLSGNAEDGWAAGEPKPAYAVAREIIVGKRPLPEPTRECDISTPDGSTLAMRNAKFAHCLVLGHHRDAEDIERWASAIADERDSYPAAILSLLASDEFNRRYSTFTMSDRAYLSFLYRLLLLRDADLEGFERYARQLADGTMTRWSVALGIVVSSEFQDRHRNHILGEPGETLASEESQKIVAR